MEIIGVSHRFIKPAPTKTHRTQVTGQETDIPRHFFRYGHFLDVRLIRIIFAIKQHMKYKTANMS